MPPYYSHGLGGPPMLTYKEQEDFFDDKSRAQIRTDFDAKCFLCKITLKRDEEHFVPLIDGVRTFNACVRGLCTRALDFHDAANGLYACQACFRLYTTTDDVQRKFVLMPCIPLMLYALHVINNALDEASRAQTLDMVFADLERDLSSTPERRRAAPFIHCYQLHPLKPPRADCTPNSSTLLVTASSTTYLIYDQDPANLDPQIANTTRYCIIEHCRRSGSMHAPSRLVHFYDQHSRGNIPLWRIPMRSPGLFFGNADAAMVDKPANPELYQVFYKLQYALIYKRGLPRNYVPEGGYKCWDDFENDDDDG
ncbi:unnamed protein product [Peniophora sp. CBMAI 1063]|nr:unnamed protein product [Peniophora sp. CBMAI 1063]